jgi:anti-sigma regulatory factor (Ser/Thr protein kinase)
MNRCAIVSAGDAMEGHVPDARAERGRVSARRVGRATLPNDATSPGRARHIIGRTLALASSDIRDVAELLASEIVTNAVAFSHGAVQVRVEVEAQAIRVSIHDDGPGLPALSDPEPLGEHGRGLHIVQALADDWGVVTSVGTEIGKTVWFTLHDS